MKLNNKLSPGSALISALFIMTLIAISATAMSGRMQNDIYRTRLTLVSDSLYLASQQVNFWTISLLSSDKKSLFKQNRKEKIFEFPTSLEKSYPNILTKGEVYDLQSKFNLNNLTDVRYFRFFVNLLKNVLPNLSSDEQFAIASATKSWVGPYRVGRGQDELVSYYAKQKPPYHQGHELFQSVSEFRLIRGVDTASFQKIAPYLAALPEVTPINMNTAPKVLLKSLGKGLNDEAVNELINARENQVFNNKEKLTQLFSKLEIPSDIVTMESQYFMSRAETTHEDLKLVNFCIFKRNLDNQGKLTVSLIQESINTL